MGFVKWEIFQAGKDTGLSKCNGKCQPKEHNELAVTEAHWIANVGHATPPSLIIWPCLLVVFWLWDLKRSGNSQQKRALPSVLCLPYHIGMHYGNCC